jgi:SAM-dependent methyltransferase
MTASEPSAAPDAWRSDPTPTDKPFAPSAERNTVPILEVLRTTLADARSVLEVGSGTGQHAVAFARALPHLNWTTADQRQHHAGIRAWLDEAGLPNVTGPLPLEIGVDDFPAGPFDAVFTANTLHFMPWAAVEGLMAAMPRVLRPGGLLVAYGPFREGGRFVSANDPDFDTWLRDGAPWRGLRDLEAVEALAVAAGLKRVATHPMPADNRCLVWQRGDDTHAD